MPPQYIGKINLPGNREIDLRDSISEMKDVALNELTEGQSLVYNGTNWINQSISDNAFSLYGVTPTSSNPSGSGNQVISVQSPTNRRFYSVYHFSDIGSTPDDTQFTLSITGGNYIPAESYIMLDNSNSEYDRLFNGISIAGIDPSNVYCQREWVSAYDILEVKIAIYKINNTLYATVTSKTGFTNGGN